MLFVNILVARLAVHSQKLVVHVAPVNHTLNDRFLELLQVHEVSLVEQL